MKRKKEKNKNEVLEMGPSEKALLVQHLASCRTSSVPNPICTSGGLRKLQ